MMQNGRIKEEQALPEYDAGNHEAWAAYFERWQVERLVSINNAPVVRGRDNSDGRRLWWGAPGRTLHAVLEYLEGGNDPPLTYPAVPVPRQSCGPWMPRRMLGGSSSSSSSSGLPALFSVKAKPVGTPLGWRNRGVVINEGGGASSSPASHLVRPKTE